MILIFKIFFAPFNSSHANFTLLFIEHLTGRISSKKRLRSNRQFRTRLPDFTTNIVKIIYKITRFN